MTYENAIGPIWRVVVCLMGLALLANLSAPAMAQDISGWRVDPDARVELGFVSAESTTRDEQLVVDGDAFTVRAQAGLDIEDENTRFRIEADRIEVFRLDENRSDTQRDRFTFLVEQELSEDWEVELRLRHYDDFVTAESSDTDEYQASVEFTYEPVREHRVRLRGTWRERDYANGADPETHGDGPRVDFEYRRRFDRYHYLTFGLRAESISSDDPRRGYERQSASVSYTQPITRDLRVRPAIQYINTEFDGRLTPLGEQRRDQLVVPELEALWWPGNFRIEAEAKYIFADSNDPMREREGYRLMLSLGYVF